MAPRSRVKCQICNEKESKYSCPKCLILYCSVICFKQHKDTSCTPASSTSAKPAQPQPSRQEEQEQIRPDIANRKDETQGDQDFPETTPLRPLTSLNWPYVPEESAYPDPLKRDDPKPLQLHQYEAIATSHGVRESLASHPRLKEILRHIDSLRGAQREEALQRALGVWNADSRPEAPGSMTLGGLGEEDRRALRGLAEAVEGAVRGGRGDALGLDWGDPA